MDIADALTKYDESTQPKEQTLPDDQQVYSVNIVMAFLRAGIPIAKLKFLWDILEENALRLTDARHMLDLCAIYSERREI